MTRADTHKSMVNSFSTCKVRIIRMPHLDKMLLLQRSQKIALRRMTVAVDRVIVSSSISNQPKRSRAKRRSKITTFGHRSSAHDLSGGTNHSMNSFARNDTNMSGNSGSHVNGNVGYVGDLESSNSSVALDDSMDIAPTNVNDIATKIIQRRMTVAVDHSFASSSISNQPRQIQAKRWSKITPFGRRSSVHALRGGTNHTNHSMNSYVQNGTNVSGNSDGMNSGNSVSSNNSMVFDDSVDIATTNYQNVNNSSGNQLISFDSDRDCDSSMNIVTNNSGYVVPLVPDYPVPATSNPQEPCSTAILDAPILVKLPEPLNPSKKPTAQMIPALIPIRDSSLFKRDEPAKKATETAMFISNFLRDFDGKKYQTASPESININQDDFSFYSDENFGHLHYSDSE